jgi:hypothetical protein
MIIHYAERHVDWIARGLRMPLAAIRQGLLGAGASFLQHEGVEKTVSLRKGLQS